MDAQELLVHDCGKGKSAERVHAGLVDLLGVLVLALKLKSKVISQMSALVISAKEPECVWIPDLQRPEVEHTFDTEVPSINIISKEEVSRLCWISTDFKELHQIIVLAVNISADSDGCIHLQKVGFLFQNLSSLLENIQCLFLSQTSFTVEMLLQECQVGLRWILRGEELLVGGRVHCRSLDILFQAVSMLVAQRGRLRGRG